ncbi:MAG: amidohydrolase [Actinomycetota bacterium]|nr:MAG: amidohydrolase [Actinomycetota bacterium]
MGRRVLFRGGHVYSPADPFATALLLDGDAVAWVGSDGAALAHADGVDEVVELDGALVAPAFVDAHVHATATGLALTGLDLRSAGSPGELLDAVAAAAAASPGETVFGAGWDGTAWGVPVPTPAELDRATGGGWCYLAHADGHSALVSTPLLAAVRKSAEAAGDRTGGLAAGRGSADGAAVVTGAAHDVARRLALDSISPAARAAAQRATRARAAAVGIGCLHELAGPHLAGQDDLVALQRLAAQEPGPAVIAYWAQLHAVDTARQLGAVGAGGELVVDGSLDSGTAWLRAPYADRPGSGLPRLDAPELAAHLVACTRAGLQGGASAVGDAAVDLVVAALQLAAAEVGTAAIRAARHRLEHADLIRPEQLATLVDLGVMVCVQPAADARWGGPGGMYEQRLGADRAAATHPLALLSARGTGLALSSAAPVTPLDPWAAVRAAAFHHNPAHRISVRAAFAAHTRGGWRAARRDDAGVLVPGAAATLAVWAVEDLVVQAPDERIATWSTDARSGTPGLPDLTPGAPEPQCLLTVVDGDVAYVDPRLRRGPGVHEDRTRP